MGAKAFLELQAYTASTKWVAEHFGTCEVTGPRKSAYCNGLPPSKMGSLVFAEIPPTIPILLVLRKG